VTVTTDKDAEIDLIIRSLSHKIPFESRNFKRIDSIISQESIQFYRKINTPSMLVKEIVLDKI
jgi:hypothetical protein